MATTPAEKTSAAGPGLKRSLSVWSAVGLSLALMAPSMAANINPQGASGGRAGGAAGVPHRRGGSAVRGVHVRPAVPVLPALRVGVRVRGGDAGAAGGGGGGLGACRYLRVLRGDDGGGGRDLRDRAADALGVWKNQPSWAPVIFVGVVLALALLLAALPAGAGTNVLLIVEVVHGHADPGGDHHHLRQAAFRALGAELPTFTLVGVQPGGPAPRCRRCSSAWCSASCRSPGSRPQ